MDAGFQRAQCAGFIGIRVGRIASSFGVWRVLAAALLAIAMETARAATLYVASAGDSKIQEFNEDGIFIRTFYNGNTAPTLIREPSGLVFDSSGSLWVGSEHLTTNGVYGIGLDGTVGTTITAGIDIVEGIAFNRAGELVVANEGRSGVPGSHSVTTYNVGGTSPILLQTYSGPAFESPHGLAIDSSLPDQNIYFADLNNHTVVRIATTGVSTFHQYTNSPGPMGVALDSAGNIFVSFYRSNEIRKYAPNGTEFLGNNNGAFMTTSFPDDGSGYHPESNYNRGLFIDANDNLYIPNQVTSTVEVIGPTGNLLRTFGTGNLQNPTYVILRPDQTWNQTGSGTWSPNGNWVGGSPDSKGYTAAFGSKITAASTVTLDGSKTAGTLSFSNPHAYTLAPAAGETLLLDNGGSAAHVKVTVGNHVIAVPVSLTSQGATVDVAQTGAGLTFTKAVSGAGPVIKSGPGTVTLASPTANAFAPSSIEVRAGTMLLAAADQIADATSLKLAGGTFATGGFHEKLGSLTLSADSTLDFGNGASVLSFAAGVWLGGTLTIKDWSGFPASGGTAAQGTDQLRFTAPLSQAFLDHLSFLGYSGAHQTVVNPGGPDEFWAVSPLGLLPVPEPGPEAAASLLLAATMLGRNRRRR